MKMQSRESDAIGSHHAHALLSSGADVRHGVRLAPADTAAGGHRQAWETVRQMPFFFGQPSAPGYERTSDTPVPLQYVMVQPDQGVQATARQTRPLTKAMTKHALPKAVRTAINRNAFRIAMTEAYEGLRKDLEKRAQTLMCQPRAAVNDVIAILDSHHILHTSGQFEAKNLPP